MMFPMLRCHCVLKTTIVFLAVQPVSYANVNEKTSGTTDGGNVSSGLDQSSVYMILKDHSETQKKKRQIYTSKIFSFWLFANFEEKLSGVLREWRQNVEQSKEVKMFINNHKFSFSK